MTPVVRSLCALTLLAAPVLAQSSLAELEQAFMKERDAMIESAQGRVQFSDIQKLAEDHAGRLRDFLRKATGSDSVNGRLMLTNILLDIGQQDEARNALSVLDPAPARAIELATAAEFADVLGMDEQRETWIATALEKDADFEERMALGMFLMTRLVEIERGEKLFADALSAAVGADQKAHVEWYRVEAIREREDLPEGSYDEQLGALAEAYPNTRWGKIAKDRLAAMEWHEGSPALELEISDLAGEELSLAKFEGDVLLLQFWASWAQPAVAFAPMLKEIAERFEPRGLRILNISVDDTRAELEQAIAGGAMPGLHAWQEGGWRSDIALRYFIEQVPDMLLISRDGKIAGLRLFPYDPEGREYLEQQIEAALGDG